MGYPGVNGVGLLSINTSAVNRWAVSDELPKVEKYVYIALEPTAPFIYESVCTLRNHLLAGDKSICDLELAETA